MPYIPEQHKKYNLLLHSVEHGGEVFSYPSELVDEIGAHYPEDTNFIPYGYDSYQEYYDYIEEYKSKATDTRIKELFDKLKHEIGRYNQKENWSVCRYIGKETGLMFGLITGKCYYWPCCAEEPKYEGVIDEEEFTSYWYATDPDLWEILEDPTGMAYEEINNHDRRNSKEYFNGVMKSLNGDRWTDI